MCGRYLILTEDEIIEYREIINEVNERYKDSPLLSQMATGEVFPTNVAPVLISEDDKPHATLMKWGFPKWQGSGVIINARAETALERKTFHLPLIQKRCVVPTAGFFEWRQDNGKKQKYLFRLPQTKMLYLAGLYNTFEQLPAYTILTTAANPSVSPYHDRMPLVLEASSIDAWLSDTPFALDYVKRPCSMELHAAAM